jgi:hypothetical protein
MSEHVCTHPNMHMHVHLVVMSMSSLMVLPSVGFCIIFAGQLCYLFNQHYFNAALEFRH